MGLQAKGATLHIYTVNGEGGTSIAGISDISPSWSRTALDDTTHDATGQSRVFIPSMIDPGEVTLTIHYVSDGATHQTLIDQSENPNQQYNMITNGTCDSLPTLNGAQSSNDQQDPPAVTTEQAYAGNKSLKTITGGDGADSYYQLGNTTGMNTLVAGAQYTLSAWVYLSEDTTKENVSIRLYDSLDGSTYAQTSSAAPTDNEVWQRLCVTRVIRASSVRALVRFYDIDTVSGYSAYWDNIILSTMPEWTIGVPAVSGSVKFYGRGFVSSFAPSLPDADGIITAQLTIKCTEPWTRP